MGVAEWFAVFCSKLQIQNGDSISNRCKAITKRLNTDFWTTMSETAHSFYGGSYGRNTAINNTSDVDLVFELPYSIYQQYNAYNGNSQSALLQAVRNSIKTRYSVTNIGADGQVVQVPFDDGLTFEVLPAFVNNDCSYTYPDSNGGGVWRVTNPKAEIEAIRSRNADCNYNLIPLCKMTRAWKIKWGVPIKGLLIDTLAYQFINTWGFRDKSFLYYDFMCRDFFEFMKNQNKEQEWWKAPGSGQYVYGKGQFQYKATQCYNIALEAIAHESATPKREWSAKQKWRDIFGTAFPD